MYESFFGFRDKPFSLLPDPSLFYPSQIHREALTLLEYGLYNQAGFTVITGEIGSGKTTLMRYLLERLERDMTVGLISHTHQSLGKILDWICAAFEIDAPRDNRLAQHRAFVDFLLNEYSKGRKTLLIVDEAQNLDRDMLEEIRLLSNINSEHDMLLQLWLLGQPELREQLRQPGLEQFIQRISASYHLGRLSQEDSCRYIRHRLKAAGGRPDIFTPDACHAIFHYSKGIPRLINLICDTALVFAYGAGDRFIDGRAIDVFVRSDGSHLLFAIDGEEIEPLAEYQPILADELDATLKPTAPPEESLPKSERESAPPPISDLHPSPLKASPPPVVEPHTLTEPEPEADAETISAHLHTASSPLGMSGPVTRGDYAPNWSRSTPGFERQRNLNTRRRRQPRWRWETTAITLGVVVSVGAVAWYSLPAGFAPLTLLGLADPAPNADALPSPAAPDPLPETVPFDVLIRLAQEPSGNDSAAPLPVHDTESEPPAASDSVETTPEYAALNRLATRLAQHGIPFESRATNQLRADLSRLIQFRDGRTALDESAQVLLAQFAALVKDDKQIRLHVVTHTDSQGSSASNQLLSQRRAADIAAVLRREGIDETRITHEGKGLSEPKFSPEDEQRLGAWINRRIEIDLIDTGAAE